MREMYKHSKGSNPLMSFVLNTQSLDEFISGMKYLDQVCLLYTSHSCSSSP